MKAKADENKKIIIGNNILNYSLRRSRRARRLRLAVYCDASVVVTLPFQANENLVNKFLNEKSKWIFSKIMYFRNKTPRTTLLSGRRNYLKFKTSSLKLTKSRIEIFNQVYKYQINKICIKNQKTRWGSCSKKKNLNFNFKLLFLPAELRDYLIVHELCHLKEFNHSSSFWKLVAITTPDFKVLRKKLNNYTL